MQIEQALDFRLEHLRRKKVRHADGAARDLILIRRPDTATRGADGRCAAGMLARFVQCHVRAQNQRTCRREAKPLRDGDASPDELVHLLHERFERDDYTVTDGANHTVTQNAGRDQMQDRLAAIDNERMTRVVAALKPNDGLRALGEHIDNGALAFVAPLSPDHDDTAAHVQPRTASSNTSPATTINKPKPRNLPSSKDAKAANPRRQACGVKNGNRPSMIK